MAKTASKLDWLRSRPDMQTPESQAWLDYLKALHPHADPLYPWLTREMKRGRIFFRGRPHGLPEDAPYEDIPGDIRTDPSQPPGEITRFRIPHIRYEDPDDVGGPRMDQLMPGVTRHWMDWFNSNHPTRQGVDINSKQFQVAQMRERVNAWDQAMRDEAAMAKVQEQNDAPNLHEWPDGWTLKRLLPKHLDYEGEKMGHCVGGFGYQDQVANGETVIASLRDPRGEPHATMELTPQNGGEEPPLDLERALANHPTARAFPEDLKNELRSFHDTGTAPNGGPTAQDIQNLYYQLWRDPNYREPNNPPLDNADIIQIQGKGNEVPKPEYQQRLKDWFQTFPEATRPNWDQQRMDDITHIGALVPEAVSVEHAPHNWGGRYREFEGEDRAEDEGYAEGGYGQHGDYGLVQPKRDIDYPETLKSIVRPQSYQDMEYGHSDYEPREMKELYREALGRGEIPELGAAFEPFAEHAMDQFNTAQDNELMYNPEYPSYPGESWDEEPERWQEMTDEFGQPIKPEEAWQDARKQYDEAEEELSNNHPWFKAENDLYRWLEPHLNSEGEYTNAPSGQDFLDPATRAAHLNMVPNEQQAFIKDLPEGAQYMDEQGLHHTITSADPLRVDGRMPGWRSNWESTMPQYIKPPVQSAGQQTFSKIARPVHPHITTGQPCTCPWGQPRLAKTAAKIDWLQERPDKFKDTPEGQYAMASLIQAVERNPKIDPLTPWLWREIKKHRIETHAGTFSYNTGEGAAGITPVPVDHWADWFESNSPTRRGVDLMQLKVNDMADRIGQWDDELAAKMEQERQMNGDILHDYGNGWTMRNVRPEECGDEGDAMGHCVGGYSHNVRNGDTKIISLRDPKNQPHATIELRPGEDQDGWLHHDPETGDVYDSHMQVPPEVEDRLQTAPHGSQVWQIQGKQNRPPDDEYANLISEYFQQLHPPAYVPVEKTHIPVPTDISSLWGYIEPSQYYGDDYYNHDPYRLNAYEAERYGVHADDDEPYEYEGPPDWDQIIDDHLHDDHQTTEQSDDLINAVDQISSREQLGDAIQAARGAHQQDFENNHFNPNHPYGFNYQTQWMNEYEPGAKIEHLAEKLGLPPTQPTDAVWPMTGYHTLHPEQEQMFQENLRSLYQNQKYVPADGQDWYKYPQYNQQGPLTFSKVASPLYYRFVFSPVSGEVDLSHNADPTPRLHGEMAAQRNEPGLVHGFAYRIGGGWRLFDWEHRPLEDPFVIAQVMRKLRNEQQETQEDDWSPEPDFDRLHHGIPS